MAKSKPNDIFVNKDKTIVLMLKKSNNPCRTCYFHSASCLDERRKFFGTIDVPSCYRGYSFTIILGI